MLKNAATSAYTVRVSIFIDPSDFGVTYTSFKVCTFNYDYVL
jgi:hypothetical protein